MQNNPLLLMAELCSDTPASILFNGYHLVAGLVVCVVAFLAGWAYGYMRRDDDYYDEVEELMRERDELKARAAK